MIRNIKIETIINNFKADTNALNYAKEYGVYEVIDGHLFYTYEGTFADSEVNEIIEILNREFNL